MASDEALDEVILGEEDGVEGRRGERGGVRDGRGSVRSRTSFSNLDISERRSSMSGSVAGG